MKFSEHWLREWVNPAIDTNALSEQLTMAGLEVDGVAPASSEFNKVVVGEVLSLEAHPNADKLRVCQVNIGEDEPLTIVCGASNVHAGMKTPTALVGANLSGFKIKPSKLRGIKSFGMLCSTEELGLAEKADGLMPLPENAPVGRDIRSYLHLDDHCFDVDLTPNRGDCASIIGIAREGGTLNRCDVNIPDMPCVASSSDKTIAVEVSASKACPHYVGRVIEGINPQAITPLWMQERLRRSGLRAISIVVDITNYVLLELGQPMHGFDLDKLNGKIKVRYAKKGEKLKLLDEQTITLNEKTLVIADDKQAIALAGIMGGFDSAIDNNSHNIFLESAYFDREGLAGCARSYGLSTDSSFRFERGVDPQLQITAIERATALLLEYAGGQAGQIVQVTDDKHLPQRPTITLRSQRIEKVLGQKIADEIVNDNLKRLGMTVEQETGQWQVTPPSFRFDINIESDLIEEIARIYGYNNLQHQAAQTAVIMQAPANNKLVDLQQSMVQRGYQETISYSFGDPDLLKKLSPHLAGVPLQNPIAKDLSVMRPTLWMGLLPALSYNQKRQQNRIRLFETGLRFTQEAGEAELSKIEQKQSIAGIITGFLHDEQWGEENRLVDFYDLKSDVENLLKDLNNISFISSEHPALHPGQTASILRNNKEIGILGRLHPQIAEDFGFKQNVYLFELDLAPLLQQETAIFTTLSKFPSVRRDLAVVIDENVNAQTLMDCMKESASDLLVQLQLFDIYRGAGIENNKKSLALGLTFRANRNLTEAEIDNDIETILTTLRTRLNASLRD